MTAPDRRPFAVTARDADALDAWLDAHATVAPFRTGYTEANGNGGLQSPGRVTTAHEHENGSGTEMESPLVTTARHVHARIGAAEAARGIPETAIWEKVMIDRLAVPTSTNGHHPTAAIPVHRNGPARPAPAAHPMLAAERVSRFQAAITALLAAAVVVGILALFSAIGSPPFAPEDDPTTATGPDGNPALVAASPAISSASPAARPTAGIERWLVDPDTASCAVDPANPPGTVDGPRLGFDPDARPLPVGGTTTGNQLAAAEVYLQFRTCRDDSAITDLLVTDAFAEGFDEASSLPPEQLARDLALGREISAAYAGRDPMSFVIKGEPLPGDASSGSYESASRPVLLPEEVVLLADGRIGGPTHDFFRTSDPGGAAGTMARAGHLETGFLVFAPENGRWVIDDYLPMCLGDCDGYWASLGMEATPTASPVAAGIASLGADGSLLVGGEEQGQPQLLRVPLDGSAPAPPPVEGYSSAIRTDQPNVVILGDAQGNQVAYNAATGVVSRSFPTRSIGAVANVGPYRVVGYTSPVDLLAVDLRTMRLTSLSDIFGAAVEIDDPAFAVQGDEAGNLILGITSAGDPGSTSAVAAFIDGATGQARTLDGWTGSRAGVAGAISPDGASIAYPAYADGALVVRTESMSGEPIRDVPWDPASRIERLAFLNATDLVVFSSTPDMVTSGLEPSSSGTVTTIRVFGNEADVQPLASLGGIDNLQGPFVSPDGSNVLYARDATIDSVAQPVWYLLDVVSGRNTERLDLRGLWSTLSPGEPPLRELVPLIGRLDAGSATGEPSDMTVWTTFNLTVGQKRTDTLLRTVNGLPAGTPDHLVVVGLSPETQTRQRGPAEDHTWEVQEGGVTVVDGASSETWSKPLPDVGTDWIVPTALVLSPDGRHIAFSAYGSDESPTASRTWVTSLDAAAPWVEVGPYTLYAWAGAPDPERAAARTSVATPAPAPATGPAATPVSQSGPNDGTLLLDIGSGVVSRPLDGTAGVPLLTYDELGPSPYMLTSVPDVVIAFDGHVAQNVRTGETFGITQYDSSMVIGPWWVQHTGSDRSAPVDARIVDLRTGESAGFFDLAAVEPAGLGQEWIIEGTDSGTLGVGIVDRAYGTGPTLKPTAVLIGGDLERARAVPLWSPRGTDGDVLAFSPDGSFVAYVTGTENDVVIRVESIAGDLIGEMPWHADVTIERLVLTNAGTLVILSEGRVLHGDPAAGTDPVAIAAYTGEAGDAILSLDGSSLLFATSEPGSETDGVEDNAWQWLDITSGESRQITDASGGSRVAAGPAMAAETVMLTVPADTGPTIPFTARFVDVATGAVTVATPAAGFLPSTPGQWVTADGTVFAAYGIGSAELSPFTADEAFGTVPLTGELLVFDASDRSVARIPFPDIPAETIDPMIIVSPDGRHVALTVRWTDGDGEHARSWITTTDGGSVWTPVEGGTVLGWVGD